MELIKGANLLLAFVLELLMLWALGYWAHGLSPVGWQRWALVVFVIALAIGAWALWAAPKSGTRLGEPWLLLFKIGMFGVAAALLALAGQARWALALAILAIVNLGLARLWRQ